MSSIGLLSQLRNEFHEGLVTHLLVIDSYKPKSGRNKGISLPSASNADASNEASRFIANHIANALGAKSGNKLPGQTSGNQFEFHVANYLSKSFGTLGHIRPGEWNISVSSSRSGTEISAFEQFEHVGILREKSEKDIILKASLGNDYEISPDIVMSRSRLDDEAINMNDFIVDENSSTRSSIRSNTGKTRILHASISCKWTMRSDRAQNARSESLNLIRNRKGRAPHIVAVAAEPTPSRLSSIALGTGDLDCVYHFALYELQNAVKALGQSEAEDLLAIMVEGRRLKDISDLPLDLAL